MTQLLFSLCLGAMRWVYTPMRLLPRRDKVTLICRQGSRPTMDCALIINALHRTRPKTHVVALAHLFDTRLQMVTAVPQLLLQMYHVATSRVVILDSYSLVVSALTHSPGLRVIQLWHALGLMKRAGYASLGLPGGRDEALAGLTRLHANYDYVACSAESCRAQIASVFGCPLDKVVVVPLPRADALRSGFWQRRARSLFWGRSVTQSTAPVVAYLPTFRADERSLQRNLDELVAAANAAGVRLIVKPHRLSNLRVPISSLEATQHHSTADLLAACDVVITDYSSVVYEAGLIGKPVLLFAFDIDAYEQERGILLDYRHIGPEVLFTSATDVIAAVVRNDFNMAEQQEFIDHFVEPVESATDGVIKLIGDCLDEVRDASAVCS